MPLDFPFAIEPGDFGVLGLLVLLEGLLSADNALILALLVRHLPEGMRKRALLYGLLGAFVFRGIGIFFAGLLIQLWWVCAIGAIYLVFLAVRHFLQGHQQKHQQEETSSSPATDRGGQADFWRTVLLVELTDIVFAVDSILVAVALVSEPEKVWMIYLGGILGILLLRFSASIFTQIIERFPALDSVAYALVGWAGVKLASAAVDIYHRSAGLIEPHLLPKWGFWTGFALILAVGIPLAMRKRRDVSAPASQELFRENTAEICPEKR